MWAIIFILFFLDITFAINQYYQQKEIRKWANYLYGEYVFIILSATAKRKHAFPRGSWLLATDANLLFVGLAVGNAVGLAVEKKNLKPPSRPFVSTPAPSSPLPSRSTPARLLDRFRFPSPTKAHRCDVHLLASRRAELLAWLNFGGTNSLSNDADADPNVNFTDAGLY